LFLFAKIKMIPECWEPLKGFPTLWKKRAFALFFIFNEIEYFFNSIIQVVLLLKYIACENKPLTNYIEYNTLYVSTNIFCYINCARIVLF
ncbi:hypothetical protein PDJ95_21880, partial [Bacillus cereus]|nr:hypothetical protein [Bacillus cereus]